MIRGHVIIEHWGGWCAKWRALQDATRIVCAQAIKNILSDYSTYEYSIRAGRVYNRVNLFIPFGLFLCRVLYSGFDHFYFANLLLNYLEIEYMFRDHNIFAIKDTFTQQYGRVVPA